MNTCPPILITVTGCSTNGYKLVWHDEFNTNGPPDPANWNYEHGFVRNNELQWYQPENAVCTNGLLVIEARREHKPNPNYSTNTTGWKNSRQWIEYTSASITSRRLREFKYGKFEMRARIDTRLGSWPAFWTLGAKRGIGWPACGEVDIMEYYTGTVLANFGYGLDSKTKWLAFKKPVTELSGDAWAKQFHIWTMEWDDQKMDLLLDGQLMNHLNLASADAADGGNPFRRPVYFILNQAIGGQCGGDPSQTEFPIRYEIDWVRVYQHSQLRTGHPEPIYGQKCNLLPPWSTMSFPEGYPMRCWNASGQLQINDSKQTMTLGKLAKILLGAVLLLGAMTQAKADDKTTDPSGTYMWTMPGRNGGADRTNTLVLKLDGDKLTGKLSAPGRGGTVAETDIADGKVAGADISFAVVRSYNGNSFTNKYSGTLADGAIKGKVESVNRNGDPQSRDWEAKLQK